MPDGRHLVPTRLSEGLVWRVARALGGSLLRAARAAADYAEPRGSGAGRGERSRVDEDTGEWPAPEVGSGG